MITQQQLQTIGFSLEEAAVYHTLLHRGEMGLQAIARATDQKRTTLYPYIQSLTEKGVVAMFVKGKRTLYVASSPERLLQQMNEKRYLLEAMLPQIAELLQTTGGNQSVVLYSTASELKAGIEDLVLSGDPVQELLTIEGDIPNMYKMGIQFWKQLLVEKKRRGIESRALVADDEKPEFILYDHPVKLRVTSQLRQFQICLYIKRDKLLLFTPSQGTGIRFINSTVSSSFRLLFESLWKKGREVNFLEVGA